LICIKDPTINGQEVNAMITNVSGVLKTYEVFKPDEKHLTAKSGKHEDLKDTVAISDKAQDYQNVRTALSNAPDVREDVVAAVRQKYASGKNIATASDIAEKLIEKI